MELLEKNYSYFAKRAVFLGVPRSELVAFDMIFFSLCGFRNDFYGVYEIGIRKRLVHHSEPFTWLSRGGLLLFYFCGLCVWFVCFEFDAGWLVLTYFIIVLVVLLFWRQVEL